MRAADRFAAARRTSRNGSWTPHFRLAWASLRGSPHRPGVGVPAGRDEDVCRDLAGDGYRRPEAASSGWHVGSGRYGCRAPAPYTSWMILSPASSALPSSAPLMLAMPSAIAVLAYAAACLRGSQRRLGLALIIGWLAQGLALLADHLGWGLPDSGARFGFAPALSATVWLVIAVYAIESRWLPLPGARRVLALLGVAAAALAWAFPGELRPHVKSMWAPLHWVLGVASYGLFGAAVLHALMWRQGDRQLRSGARTVARSALSDGPSHLGMPLMKIESLIFRFVRAGFAVLTVAILLGWWVASPWQWDHKTVFSVLAWAVFAALLAGRATLGWRGRTATRWLYAGSALLLLAYVGSRFVLEVVLQRPPGS